MTIGVSQARGLASAMCLVALVLAVATPLLGPLSLMNDLRGDLRHLEVLKTWPVKGGALIRGEMLWPGMLLTAGSLARVRRRCHAVVRGLSADRSCHGGCRCAWPR